MKSLTRGRHPRLKIAAASLGALGLIGGGVLAAGGSALAQTYPEQCSAPGGGANCTNGVSVSVSVQLSTTETLYLSQPTLSFGSVVNGQSSANPYVPAEEQWYVAGNDTAGESVGIEPTCVNGGTCGATPGQLQNGAAFIPDSDIHIFTTGPSGSGTNADGITNDTFVDPTGEVNLYSFPASGSQPGNAGTAALPVTDQWTLNVPVTAVAGTYSQSLDYVLIAN